MNHIFHRDRWKVHDPRFALLRLYPYITFTSYTHKYRSTENAYYHPFPLLNDILRVDPNLRSIIKKRKNLSLLSNLLSSSKENPATCDGTMKFEEFLARSRKKKKEKIRRRSSVASGRRKGTRRNFGIIRVSPRESIVSPPLSFLDIVQDKLPRC